MKFNIHAHSVSLSIYAVYYLEADQCVQTVHMCTCKEYFSQKDK